ncbi:helix-turn-helix transcriptional regulator [Chitinophaga filiformis]|uniref:Predicted transcriptional regulator, ArsR family n=1 Tax=Chitinophaga filiformis TaxID=104663 RepID=A0A1G7XV65_CHIFI|nr:replication-relaxation family protein [Chitinophaga filiformis]SDG88051.1 Predicted transcriptional regulator, ArsR family [Chitinophaga filiformis]
MENYRPITKATADKFLQLLKTKGPQSAAMLAAALRMTGEGARLQLLKLAEEGLVVSATTSRGVGRPVQIWDLTPLGHAHFPDTHVELTLQIIETIRKELGEEALVKVVAAREFQQQEKYMKALSGITGLAERLAQFATIRSSEGYLAEWREEEDGFIFIENHCPICCAATQCANICTSELNTFQAIMGDGAEVKRVDHIIAGDRRCVYEIKKVKELVISR